MDDNKLSLSDYQIFLFKSLLLIGLAWIGFLLALTGFFYASIAWFLFAVIGYFLIKHAVIYGISFKPSREMVISTFIFWVIVALFLSFSSPTVFSGRDQGSISEAAVRLSQNHTLKFSTSASKEFFKLHEKGQAQNFPGFYYTSDGQLTTQFPLVYIVWLALFYSVFGTAGFAIANAILLYLFFKSFYLLTRLFLKTSSALPTIIFATTSFAFMWFSKFTLSENMALPLLWASLLSLVLFLRGPRKLNYATFLASMILLCFTRIEGFGVLLFSTIVIAINKDARDYIKYQISYKFFLPLAIFAAIFIANMLQDISFYTEIAKALFPHIKSPQPQLLGDMKNTVLPQYYVWKIFYLYGFLGFFVLGFFGILEQICKKDFYKLVPLFVVAPTFIYFLDSHITLDHPWMLRRFIFSILPAAIFYTGLLLGEKIEAKIVDRKSRNFLIISCAISVILVFFNLSSFLRYLTFSENKNLLPQVESLSKQFSSNDLILIDRETTDDGWSMISGPMSFLYGKNSVYFFNNQDLARLNLDAFDNVYLIAPKEQVPYYLSSTIGDKLTHYSYYNFAFSKLNMEDDAPLRTIEFPQKKEFNVSGEIFKIEK